MQPENERSSTRPENEANVSSAVDPLNTVDAANEVHTNEASTTAAHHPNRVSWPVDRSASYPAPSSPHTGHTPHMGHTPHTPYSPYTPHTPHTPYTPHTPHTPQTPGSKRFTQKFHASTPNSQKEREKSKEFPFNRTSKINLKNFGKNSLSWRFNQQSGDSEPELPLTAVARIAHNAKTNLRMWYLRHHNGESHRQTEFEMMREREKSEMLFYQLFSVTPMVVLAASSLQAEEGREKTVPCILQQISFKVTVGHAKHYHHMIKIHMEYGAGFTPMRWEIIRGNRDLQILRGKLKTGNFRSGIRGKKLKLPKLPKPEDFQHIHHHQTVNANSSTVPGHETSDTQHSGSASPNYNSQDFDFELSVDEDDVTLDEEYDDDDDEDEYDDDDEDEDEDEENLEEGGNVSGHGNSTHTTGNTTSASRGGSTDQLARTRARGVSDASQRTKNKRPASFSEALEDWLNKIKRIYMFRSDSNDLMQFLEFSHLGLKLSCEYMFHGKEGSLIIRSRASDLGWRVGHLHPHDFKDMITRHTKKWVLVRDSYIVIVDNIYSTRIREVFMVDPYFEVKHVKEELLTAIHRSTDKKTEGLGINDSANNTSQSHSNSQSPSNTAQSGKINGREPTDSRNVSTTGDESRNFTGTGIKTVQTTKSTTSMGALAEPNIPKGSHKSISAKSVFLHLTNNSRELKLAALSERDLRRWQASILQMQRKTLWSKKNRFDSFAPVRNNVFGQWFVDARDYMWVLSEALENARDTIFILDWWLSPELYLRRPPEGNQKWRLDRVLKRKAEQGVKIFVVVYRNVGDTIPIDSLWTKHSLLDLHPNIYCMRSPYQLKNKSALFWAHHEKMCVIDNTVAFNGGIDLCYGRWDTWQHVLTDDVAEQFLPDKPTKDQWKQPSQLFVGKDYSNARVKDFFELNKPYDDMYDRTFVPRMPWHDIQQMTVGQPARDLARHFVQRWNYVLRQKAPSRLTPLLLPPPDFTPEDLERMQLTGTCEYQVLRSSGPWSLGLKEHEQSIQNAYLKLIEESEHMVYIENQFFITSTVVDGIVIENKIGDALVQRIIRAHEKNEPWKAYIIIPLLPGFEADVGTEKAGSVRVICQCQFYSISRGPNSIFSRLESVGIRPDKYIHFLSLRKWGKFDTDPTKPSKITTEILYVHAKLLIVDDRIAIIGSANVNERSMRGDRDSEVAVCVRDTSIVESKMAGKPWKAAKFAHSLRVRLMREHLGVDIDKLEVVERCMEYLEKAALKSLTEEEFIREKRKSETFTASDIDLKSPDNKDTAADKENKESETKESETKESKETDKDGDRYEKEIEKEMDGDAERFKDFFKFKDQKGTVKEYPTWLYPELHSFNWYAGTSVNRGIRDHKKLSADSRIQSCAEHKEDVTGFGRDHYNERKSQEEEVKQKQYQAARPDFELESSAEEMMNTLLKDDTISTRMEFMRRFYDNLTTQDTQRPVKKVGDLPMPRTNEAGSKAENNENIPIDPWSFDDPVDPVFVRDKWLACAERNTLIFRLVFRCQPDDDVETWKDYKMYLNHYTKFCKNQKVEGGTDILHEGETETETAEAAFRENVIRDFRAKNLREGSSEDNDFDASDLDTAPSRPMPGLLHKNKRSRRWNHFDQIMDPQVAEDMLKGITGHLVLFPTEWLNREIDSGNWNFQLDRMAPLEIFD